MLLLIAWQPCDAYSGHHAEPLKVNMFRLLVLVASCYLLCVKQLLSAEPGSSNTDMIDDEDAAEKPYNDLRVIRRALTAATQTDQMEAAWGHDPRWQVCMLCNSFSPFCPLLLPPPPPLPCCCIQVKLPCGMDPTPANGAPYMLCITSPLCKLCPAAVCVRHTRCSNVHALQKW